MYFHVTPLSVAKDVNYTIYQLLLKKQPVKNDNNEDIDNNTI